MESRRYDIKTVIIEYNGLILLILNLLTQSHRPMHRDSRKSRQKMAKTRQTFVKITKITAKTRHQITGQNTIIQSIGGIATGVDIGIYTPQNQPK